MPHLDIKFQPKIVSGELISNATEELTKIIGKHFQENPAYVSVEVLPQTSWIRNRKPIDMELNCDPDSESLRSSVAEELAIELAQFMKTYLKDNCIECEISAWVRIFQIGKYIYQA